MRDMHIKNITGKHERYVDTYTSVNNEAEDKLNELSIQGTGHGQSK